MIPRPRLSSTTVCYPLSVSPRFTLARALEGFRGVGLACAELVAIPGYCPHLTPDAMDAAAIAQVQALLQQQGLETVALNVAADLTTPAGVAFLGHAMRVAQALGAGITVANVEQTATPEGEAGFRALVPTICNLAERYDQLLALEIHGGLIATGVQGVALLKELGADRLKLTYDMANVVYYGGVLPEEDLGRMGSDIGRYVAHVHLKDKANLELGDYDFPAFGSGILDFDRVLTLLHDGGYRGAMTLEVELDGKPETPEQVDTALAASHQYLERYWAAPAPPGQGAP